MDDGYATRATSYGVYISQLIHLSRTTSQVSDFNNLNKILIVKHLKQRYRDRKLRKTFSKFYRRHSHLIPKYNVGLKALLQEGLSEPSFYVDKDCWQTIFGTF